MTTTCYRWGDNGCSIGSAGNDKLCHPDLATCEATTHGWVITDNQCEVAICNPQDIGVDKICFESEAACKTFDNFYEINESCVKRTPCSPFTEQNCYYGLGNCEAVLDELEKWYFTGTTCVNDGEPETGAKTYLTYATCCAANECVVTFEGPSCYPADCKLEDDDCFLDFYDCRNTYAPIEDNFPIWGWVLIAIGVVLFIGGLIWLFMS